MLQLGHGIFSVEMTYIDTATGDIYSLQLGHGIFSVEIGRQRHGAHGSRRASIGPRYFLRGNDRLSRLVLLEDLMASIGPRYFLRGNSLHKMCSVVAFLHKRSRAVNAVRA
jgi:hypothetical protein